MTSEAKQQHRQLFLKLTLACYLFQFAAPLIVKPSHASPGPNTHKFVPGGPPLTINWIRPGMKREEVLSKLTGSSTESYSLGARGSRIFVRRIGLVIHLSQNGVVTEVRGHSLEQGKTVLLKAGDPEEKIFAVLGKPDSDRFPDVGPTSEKGSIRTLTYNRLNAEDSLWSAPRERVG